MSSGRDLLMIRVADTLLSLSPDRNPLIVPTATT
jgi:hypothetical protein